MRELRPGRPRLSDHFVAVFSVLAAPTPYLVRTLVVAVVILSLVAGATAASADSLPDEPLYGLKLASEHVRLSLARTPADRAAVELSLAERRLAEAERLAADGRESAALVSSSAYGEHLANAAAELASVERLEPKAAPLVAQLISRLVEQRAHTAATAAKLAHDPRTAAAAEVLSKVASVGSGNGSTTVSERVAEQAASLTGTLATVARDRVEASRAAEREEEEQEEDEEKEAPASTAAPGAAAQRTDSPRRTDPPRRTEPAKRTEDPRRAEPTKRPEATRPLQPAAQGNVSGPQKSATTTAKAKPSPTAKAHPTVDPKVLKEAAEKAKRAAEKAREALRRAKEAAKKTPSPPPKKKP